MRLSAMAHSIASLYAMRTRLHISRIRPVSNRRVDEPGRLDDCEILSAHRFFRLRTPSPHRWVVVVVGHGCLRTPAWLKPVVSRTTSPTADATTPSSRSSGRCAAPVSGCAKRAQRIAASSATLILTYTQANRSARERARQGSFQITRWMSMSSSR